MGGEGYKRAGAGGGVLQDESLAGGGCSMV